MSARVSDPPELAPGSAGAAVSEFAVPVGILGSGLHLPPRRVTNAELIADLDTTDAWIRSKLGVHERRFVSEGLMTSDMCVAAALEALDDVGLPAADVDALVLATFTPDQPLPSTAIVVADRIGATRAVPVDLTQGACAGGVLALLVAAHLLQNPAIRHVLVIGADAMSRITDPAERTTRVIFGDAAAALVVGRVPAGHGLLAWDIGTDLSEAVTIPAGGVARPPSAETLADGGHYLHMEGRAAFSAATGRLPVSIRAACARAGVGVEDVAFFALHQANGRIIDSVMDQLGVPGSRAGRTLDRMGNTASASVLTVLYEAREQGRLAPGDLVVVSGIGAGLLWGSLCLRIH